MVSRKKKILIRESFYIRKFGTLDVNKGYNFRIFDGEKDSISDKSKQLMSESAKKRILRLGNPIPKGSKRTIKEIENMKIGISEKRKNYNGRNNPFICRKWKITNIKTDEVFIIEDGIETFCKERGLTRSLLTARAKGKTKTPYLKTWMCEYMDDKVDVRAQC